MNDLFNKYKIGFIWYFTCVCGKTGKVKWEERLENLIPDDGVDYILEAALNGGSQFSNWYIGLWDAAYTPAGGDTMADLIAAIVSEIQTYAGGARKALAPDAIASGLYSNAATPAQFVFSADKTVRGGFQASSSTWDNTTGQLISSVEFSSPRSVENGDTLKVVSGIQLTSA